MLCVFWFVVCHCAKFVILSVDMYVHLYMTLISSVYIILKLAVSCILVLLVEHKVIDYDSVGWSGLCI